MSWRFQQLALDINALYINVRNPLSSSISYINVNLTVNFHYMTLFIYMPEELLGKVQCLRFLLFVLHLLIQQDKMLVEALGYHRNCSKYNKFIVLQGQNHGLILIHCIQDEIKYDNTNSRFLLTVCTLFFFTWSGVTIRVPFLFSSWVLRNLNCLRLSVDNFMFSKAGFTLTLQPFN